ncbi:MAG: hypothetical protein K9G62_04480 [Alphaproteobacteria bacterium]|nr:hypothetical protein [Alphaproteobacteria bacterium]
MTNAISTALFGLQAASVKAGNSASRIANPETQDTLAADLVDLMVAKNEHKANIEVIKTASAMEDELLHIFDKKV